MKLNSILKDKRMFVEINDSHRTGYMDKDGKKVGTINVNGFAQIIGDCKYVEIDDDTKKVVSIRKELPSKKEEPKEAVKPKAKKNTKKVS